MNRASTRAIMGAATLATLVLAGCTAEADAGDGARNDLGPEAAASYELVMSHTPAVEQFTAPGPALGDLSALAGTTVVFMPANYDVPMFQNVHSAIGEALAEVNVSVELCDGQANPAQIAACLRDAVAGGAGAVISGSLPEEMAPDAFAAVKAADIPLLFMQVAKAGEGDPSSVAYLTPDYVELQSWNAHWVIADSNADATVLVVRVTDTPATSAWIDYGAIATYAEKCSTCEVVVLDVTTTDLAGVPQRVADSLESDPEIGYVHAAFDSVVAPIVEGLVAAEREDVRVVTQDGTLPIMQDLVAARQVSSVVGFNQKALGWYAADQVLRMMSGETAVQELDFPYRRVFTKDTANLVEFTQEAELSGIWYGAVDYTDGFRALWGVR